MSLKERTLVTAGNRITIPDTLRKKLDIKEGDFVEMETYGTDKILITFFKVGDRSGKITKRNP